MSEPRKVYTFEFDADQESVYREILSRQHPDDCQVIEEPVLINADTRREKRMKAVCEATMDTALSVRLGMRNTLKVSSQKTAEEQAELDAQRERHRVSVVLKT